MSDDPLETEADREMPRMTLGEHLDELRRRLMWGLLGFAIALGVALIYGRKIVEFLSLPLMKALKANSLSPQVYFTEVADPFVVFIKVSVLAALVVAMPWIAYQLWKFVAAGLYTPEKRTVMRYAPFSVGLFVVGAAFAYMFVLPWTIEWLVAFALPEQAAWVSPSVPTTQPMLLQSIPGTPQPLQEGQYWLDTTDHLVKVFVSGQVRVVSLLAPGMASPLITLPEYVEMVLWMLLLFGLSFQLPIVVMALVRLGILEISDLHRFRRHVYLALAVIASIITPGDVATTTIALVVPLCLLYELGVFLAWINTRKT